MNPRAFAVDRSGVIVELAGTEAQLRHMGVSPEVSAAYDIMTDSGQPAEQAARMALAAERMHATGELRWTPEEFARHLAKLRRAVTEHDAPPQ